MENKFRMLQRLLYLATCIVLLEVHPLSAQNSLYKCSDTYEPYITICDNPKLKNKIDYITQRILEFKYTSSPILNVLANEYTRYLSLKIWSCRTEITNSDSVGACLQSLLDFHSFTLSNKITKDVIIKLIKSGSFVDIALARTFPADFVGYTGNACGNINVGDFRGSESVATFQDCADKSVVVLILKEADHNLLELLAARPSFLSWFRGRFELVDGKFQFVVGHLDGSL